MSTITSCADARVTKSLCWGHNKTPVLLRVDTYTELHGTTEHAGELDLALPTEMQDGSFLHTLTTQDESKCFGNMLVAELEQQA